MPHRIFLDTNVWFSSLYGSENCRKLIQAAREKAFIPVISVDVLDELVVNLKRKIPHTFPEFEDMIVHVAPEVALTPNQIPDQVKRAIDTKDQKIFTTALKANIDYFITGNIKDFKRNRRKKIGNITILTPKEAVEVLGLS